MADGLVPLSKLQKRKNYDERCEDLKDRQSLRTMRERVAYCLLITFMFVMVAVMAIIILNGLGVTAVPIGIVCTLIGETIVHGVAMFCTVTRWLFR